MTRVETSAPSTEKLTKEIKHQIDVDLKKVRRRRKILRIGGCLIVVLVLGGGLFFTGAWMMAASGLYNVPIISAWAFHTPEPLHEVKLGEGVKEENALDQMRTEINNLINTQYAGQVQVSEANVVLDEELLTSFLVQNISDVSETRSVEIIKSQIAIEPEGMEIFLHMIWREQPIYISVVAVPRVIENDIKLDIISAHLGNLPLPTWVVGHVINVFFGSAMNILQIPMVGFINIESIDLIYGKLRLNGEIEYTTF